ASTLVRSERRRPGQAVTFPLRRLLRPSLQRRKRSMRVPWLLQRDPPRFRLPAVAVVLPRRDLALRPATPASRARGRMQSSGQRRDSTQYEEGGTTARVSYVDWRIIGCSRSLVTQGQVRRLSGFGQEILGYATPRIGGLALTASVIY